MLSVLSYGVKENIHKYNGDKDKIGITGDSAGAYICAMILNLGNKIGKKEDFAEDHAFEPTYLPKDVSLEEVAKDNLLDVKAAVLSYGGYDFYKYALQNAETYKNIFWWLALSKPEVYLEINLTLLMILKYIKRFLLFTTFLKLLRENCRHNSLLPRLRTELPQFR